MIDLIIRPLAQELEWFPPLAPVGTGVTVRWDVNGLATWCDGKVHEVKTIEPSKSQSKRDRRAMRGYIIDYFGSGVDADFVQIAPTPDDGFALKPVAPPAADVDGAAAVDGARAAIADGACAAVGGAAATSEEFNAQLQQARGTLRTFTVSSSLLNVIKIPSLANTTDGGTGAGPVEAGEADDAGTADGDAVESDDSFWATDRFQGNFAIQERFKDAEIFEGDTLVSMKRVDTPGAISVDLVDTSMSYKAFFELAGSVSPTAQVEITVRRNGLGPKPAKSISRQLGSPVFSELDSAFNERCEMGLEDRPIEDVLCTVITSNINPETREQEGTVDGKTVRRTVISGGLGEGAVDVLLLRTSKDVPEYLRAEGWSSDFLGYKPTVIPKSALAKPTGIKSNDQSHGKNAVVVVMRRQVLGPRLGRKEPKLPNALLVDSEDVRKMFGGEAPELGAIDKALFDSDGAGIDVCHLAERQRRDVQRILRLRDCLLKTTGHGMRRSPLQQMFPEDKPPLDYQAQLQKKFGHTKWQFATQNNLERMFLLETRWRDPRVTVQAREMRARAWVTSDCV